MPDNTKRPIAFFIPALNGGGAQRVVVNLANALVDLTDHPIHVVLIRKEGPFLTELHPNVTIVELKGSRTLTAILSLSIYLKRRKPAVLMASMNYVNVAAVFAHRLAGQPCRLVVREANVLAPKGSRANVRSHVVQLLMRLSYQLATELVANSEDTLSSLKHAGVSLPANCQVIGNPVTLPKLEGYQGYKAPRNVPYICAVGRLAHQKGFDVLLRALAASGNQNLHLIILGEGPLRDPLMEQARALGLEDRFHLPGFLNPPTEVMQNAKAFILSSRWEGFGNVLVEALALGVPIVSTDCPGGPREILAGGRYGLLVPVDDVTALAEAIQQTLENPVATPEAQRERADTYSPIRIAQEYLDRALLPES